jgi:hypothetical protein
MRAILTQWSAQEIIARLRMKVRKSPLGEINQNSFQRRVKRQKSSPLRALQKCLQNKRKKKLSPSTK